MSHYISGMITLRKATGKGGEGDALNVYSVINTQVHINSLSHRKVMTLTLDCLKELSKTYIDT